MTMHKNGGQIILATVVLYLLLLSFYYGFDFMRSRNIYVYSAWVMAISYVNAKFASKMPIEFAWKLIFLGITSTLSAFFLEVIYILRDNYSQKADVVGNMLSYLLLSQFNLIVIVSLLYFYFLGGFRK